MSQAVFYCNSQSILLEGPIGLTDTQKHRDMRNVKNQGNIVYISEYHDFLATENQEMKIGELPYGEI